MTERDEQIPVGVLGATGLVGQRLVSRLVDHPWFELIAIAASDDRVGDTFGDTVTWRIDEPLPEQVSAMSLDAAAPDELTGTPPLVLSALPGRVAADLEGAFAEAGYLVCSNASPDRMAADVPLLIPEVNRDHLDLLDHQRDRRGWDGAVVKNPNCMTTTITLPLAALQRFGLQATSVVSMQAISGAGTGGVHGIDIVDNVLPDIPNEADKLRSEPAKLLGTRRSDGIDRHHLTVEAACHRVPVLDGHMATCFVSVEDSPTCEDVIDAFTTYPGVDLPSAPAAPIQVIDQRRRPQPRYDRDAGEGMSVSVGPVSVEDDRIAFTCLAHNTVRGAAGACLLAAEAAVDAGYHQ